MLRVSSLYTKEREKSDMDDLEILGSITFDLQINKDEAVKKAFVSLVSKLGTQEFLQEYSLLYSKIVSISRANKCKIFPDIIEEAFILTELQEEKEKYSSPLESSILNEISISTSSIEK